MHFGEAVREDDGILRPLVPFTFSIMWLSGRIRFISPEDSNQLCIGATKQLIR